MRFSLSITTAQTANSIWTSDRRRKWWQSDQASQWKDVDGKTREKKWNKSSGKKRRFQNVHWWFPLLHEAHSPPLVSISNAECWQITPLIWWWIDVTLIWQRKRETATTCTDKPYLIFCSVESINAHLWNARLRAHCRSWGFTCVRWSSTPANAPRSSRTTNCFIMITSCRAMTARQDRDGTYTRNPVHETLTHTRTFLSIFLFPYTQSRTQKGSANRSGSPITLKNVLVSRNSRTTSNHTKYSRR